MKLVLTYYVEASPESVTRRIQSAVLDPLRAEATDDGVRVTGGVDGLDGSEIHVEGDQRLTTVRIEVPWPDATRTVSTLRAASRFASTITDGVLAA